MIQYPLAPLHRHDFILPVRCGFQAPVAIRPPSPAQIAALQRDAKPKQQADTSPLTMSTATMDTIQSTSIQDATQQGAIVFNRTSRPKRKRITPEQLEVLVSLFAQTDTPSYELREAVGLQVAMSNREVQVWFQNRRAKERLSRQKQQRNSQQQHDAQDPESPSSTASPPPPTIPDAKSSPPRPQYEALPSNFNTGRRRSVSASAAESISPMPLSTYGEIYPNANYRQPQRPSSVEPRPATGGIGPVRPKFNRYHSHTAGGTYSRTSIARNTAWQNTSAAFQPQSAHPRTHSARDEDLHHNQKYSPRSSPKSLTFPHDCQLPTLPMPKFSPRFGQGSSAYFDSNIPASQTTSASLADRRSHRLPPVKLLLDMADLAYPVKPPAGQSSLSPAPLLTSPFDRLSLRSPCSSRVAESDRSYFDLSPQMRGQSQIPSFDGQPHHSSRLQ